MANQSTYSDEEEAAFKRGYRMGVEAARSELMKSVGDTVLVTYARECACPSSDSSAADQFHGGDVA